MCYGWCFTEEISFWKKSWDHEWMPWPWRKSQTAGGPSSQCPLQNQWTLQWREREGHDLVLGHVHTAGFFLCALFHIIRIFKHSAMWTFPGPVDMTLQTEVNMDVTHVSVSIWTLLCDQCRSIWSLCRPLSPGAERADLRWWNSSDQQHCFYSTANLSQKLD